MALPQLRRILLIRSFGIIFRTVAAFETVAKHRERADPRDALSVHEAPEFSDESARNP